jgi:hypothetical protein
MIKLFKNEGIIYTVQADFTEKEVFLESVALATIERKTMNVSGTLRFIRDLRILFLRSSRNKAIIWRV